MILFIKHIDIEGPDALEKFFSRHGFKTQTIELHNGGPLPGDLNDIEAVVSLGGPMNVYEENKYPFLTSENRFIQEVVSKKVPFIGICLGSQLLAKACGAKVKKSPVKEIGFFPVQLNKDDLFDGVGGQINAFHWHEDMSELPPRAALLASSRGCPHQAFKVGPRAYGLQFHIEVTEPTIRKWMQEYFSKGDHDQARQGRQIIEEYRKQQKEFCKVAEVICSNFTKIIHNYSNEKAPK